MDEEKLQKLAKTFKDNGLAANMDEAVRMAKNILSGAGGEQETSKDLEVDMEKLKLEEEALEQDEAKTHKQIEELKKDLDKEEAELEALNKEIQALNQVQKDAEDVIKEEKKDAKVDNLAEEDLE